MRGVCPVPDTIGRAGDGHRWLDHFAARSGRKRGSRVSVLDEIIDGVRADLAERQDRVTLDELKERATRARDAKDGVAALRGDGVKVICEVKRSSPSKGAL